MALDLPSQKVDLTGRVLSILLLKKGVDDLLELLEVYILLRKGAACPLLEIVEKDLVDEETDLLPLQILRNDLPLPEAEDILIIKLEGAAKIAIEGRSAKGISLQEPDHLVGLRDRTGLLALEGDRILDGLHIALVVALPF